MCPDFSKSCREAFSPAVLKEVSDALEEEYVVVVVLGYSETRSIVMEANCLETGEILCEDSDP